MDRTVSLDHIAKRLMLAKRSLRQLMPDIDGMAPPPFPYDSQFFQRLRPDQVPRFLGALSDPSKLPLVTVPLAALIAIQDRVLAAKVEAMRGSDKASYATVARVGRNLFIIDGHHRAAAAYLDGASTIQVRFKDLTEMSNAVKSKWMR
jgi:hypothetical protein